MIRRDTLRALRARPVGAAVAAVLVSVSSVAAEQPVALAEAKCTSPALAATIRPSQVGEPVSGVEFALKWVAATGNTPAHCMVSGSILPVDKSATARPIKFGVALPAEWNHRAVQMGGGGMNGTVPGLTGGFGGGPGLSSGFATYGSDSGHANGDNQWGLNDEAIRNFGYAQLKKTHDVAMVLIERAYGAKPRYNYFVGNSQGGREALTVTQRYPKDYDGVMSTVPIVGFSSQFMSRVNMRKQELALRNWVSPTKGNAVVAEFMRRCDNLDGLTDGIINNYYDCRALFDVNDGVGEADPWKAKRCPNDIDPKPDDATQNACLTSGHIETLQMVFSRRMTELKLANGRKDFGMFAPTSSLASASTLEGAVAAASAGGAPRMGGAGGARAGGPPGGGGGFLQSQRFRGQEGAPADAPNFASSGTIGVYGFVMQDLDANPIEVDEKKYRARLELMSSWFDATDPDLSAFNKRGGKLLVTVGTDDTTAASGEQLRYYQTVLDKMGRKTVDSFARLYVIPQGGHGLSGRAAPINGDGKVVTDALQVPSSADRFAMLQNWVEKGVAPGRSEVVSAGARTMPMCSYPEYPRYSKGDINQASSYACTAPSAVAK